MKETARSVHETHAVASKIARLIVENLKEDEGVVVGLTGTLGAGKTEFVRGFMAGIASGRARDVCSPTYAILQIYDGDPVVRHMDLYRLESLQDLEAVGYRDHYLEPGIALVEWIERVPEAIPEQWIEIALVVSPSDVREITLRVHGARWAQIFNLDERND